MKIEMKLKIYLQTALKHRHNYADLSGLQLWIILLLIVMIKYGKSVLHIDKRSKSNIFSF